VFFVVSILMLLQHSPPTLAMIAFSVSLTIGPVALLSSIPPLLRPIRSTPLPARMPLLRRPSLDSERPTAVGTGLGLYKAAANIGMTILDILIGLQQDKSTGYVFFEGESEYYGVLWTLLVVGILAVGASVLLWWSDWRNGSVLENNVPATTEITTIQWWNVSALLLVIVALVVSWWMFFKFLL
jgi:hypothetical protein